MARNYPSCDCVFNSTFVDEESSRMNISQEDVQSNLTDGIDQCEYRVFNYKTDAYVYALIGCYSVILPIGFFGNLAIIFVVLKTKELKTVTNLLLVALAVSDLIVTVIMPFSILQNISYDYNGPTGLCKAIPMLQGAAIMAGIYTLVFIALERFNTIVHPHRRRVLSSPTRVAVAVTLIWILSVCFQIPIVVVLDVEYSEILLESANLNLVEDCPEVCFYITIRSCIETWSETKSLSFSYAILFVMYVIPLSGLVILYFRIAHFLWKRRPVGASSIREADSYKRRKHLILFLVLLVVAFAVLWGPYFIVLCVIEHISNPIIPPVLQVLGHVNVAVDPILYACFHQKIRKHGLGYLKTASTFWRRQPPRNGCGKITNSQLPQRRHTSIKKQAWVGTSSAPHITHLSSSSSTMISPSSGLPVASSPANENALA